MADGKKMQYCFNPGCLLACV